MKKKKIIIKVYGMSCISCENKITDKLKSINGVLNVKASRNKEQVEVVCREDNPDIEECKKVISELGYSLKKQNNYLKFIGIILIGALILALAQYSNSLDMGKYINVETTYPILFMVGVLSSFHCIGMCGGIMISQSISTNGVNNKTPLKTNLLYNAGRVVSYTLIGGFVGFIGSMFSLSITMRSGIVIFAGLFMLIMGLNLMQISFFKKISFRLPWGKCNSKLNSSRPFIVGLLNGFMPCGALQTIQIFALGTGSFAGGAFSMFLFSLGTVPLMLTVGLIAGGLTHKRRNSILKFSGGLVLFLGIIMVDRGLSLGGINPLVREPTEKITINQNVNTPKTEVIQDFRKAKIDGDVQVLTTTAENYGYTPKTVYVQKDKSIKWIILGNEINSCNNEIIIPSLGIEKKLKLGENVIELGKLTKDLDYTCYMGMLTGKIKVVDNLNTLK